MPAAKSQFADQKKIADKINQDSSANNVLPKPNLNKLQSNTHNNHQLNEPNSETGDWKPMPFYAGEDPDPEIRSRRDTIREMMQHAWKNYVKFAWGENELNPISRTGHSAGIFGNTKIGSLIAISLKILILDSNQIYTVSLTRFPTNLTTQVQA